MHPGSGYDYKQQKTLQINCLRCLCFCSTGKSLAKGHFLPPFQADFHVQPYPVFHIEFYRVFTSAGLGWCHVPAKFPYNLLYALPVLKWADASLLFHYFSGNCTAMPLAHAYSPPKNPVHHEGTLADSVPFFGVLNVTIFTPHSQKKFLCMEKGLGEVY